MHAEKHRYWHWLDFSLMRHRRWPMADLRSFLAALRHGIRVETPSEFLTSLKKKR